MNNQMLHTIDRVGRSQLESILNSVNSTDIQCCLQILNTALDNRNNYQDSSDLIPLLKSPATTDAQKSIALFVFKSWRTICCSTSTGNSEALKDLLWLRARLNARSYTLKQSANCTANTALSAKSHEQITGGDQDEIRSGIVRLYQLHLARTPANSEVDYWHGEINRGMGFDALSNSIINSPEAIEFRKHDLSLLSDGQFIQLVYELILDRGANAFEIATLEKDLADKRIDRITALHNLFRRHADAFFRETEQKKAMPVHDKLSFHIMGSDQYVSVSDWDKRAEELASQIKPIEKETQFHARFHIKCEPKPLVTAICSLYRGGRFIDQFMENITSQSFFNDYCELVIIDADSPENESKVIERYCSEHKNIVYKRINHRIGIYDAWNIAAQMARGTYITNTNLDDIRRIDSFELQASTLENLPFIDVVYQDFFYTSEPFLRFEEIARFGYKSELPIVTNNNMMCFNSPHNAPMWRKKLHDELGYFDPSYQSAGDYEFWLRCLVAGKIFYKINDPHVAYYQNPGGVSTRPDSKGFAEWKQILKKYGGPLVSENVVMPFDEFTKKISPMPVMHAWNSTSRYACAQDALHAVAIRTKYVHTSGEQ